jgi:hypothetical protein
VRVHERSRALDICVAVFAEQVAQRGDSLLRRVELTEVNAILRC